MATGDKNDNYILNVSNLTVEISNKPIINNLNFKIKRGITLAIVGPNGAGKTTLFRALLNLVPYSGKIEWNGKMKIGYVPQVLSVCDIAISVAVISLTRLIYRKIVLGLISEELAISKGISIARNNLLYLLLVSLTVAMGIQITGTLLVGFLVVTPAAAAKTISANLSKYLMLSSIFGAISAISGILLSSYFNILPGPLVVISGIAIFVVTIIIRWRMKFTS